MTTADYALIISLVSALISLIALLWNVWQKYIFVKPALQTSFSVMQSFEPGPNSTATTTGQSLLVLSATNLGPGPAILHSCIGRSRLRWERWRLRRQIGFISPIHGNPLSPTPQGIGPFGGGLPAKIDAADSKSFYFPYDRECLLKEPLVQIGVHDTYGRTAWCRRKDYRRALKAWRKDFMQSEP